MICTQTEMELKNNEWKIYQNASLCFEMLIWWFYLSKLTEGFQLTQKLFI